MLTLLLPVGKCGSGGWQERIKPARGGQNRVRGWRSDFGKPRHVLGNAGRDLQQAGRKQYQGREDAGHGAGSGGLETDDAEVLGNPVRKRVKTRESEAPAELLNSRRRCEPLSAFLRSSGGGATVYVEGMRLSRCFALPAPPSCRQVKVFCLQTGAGWFDGG